MGEEADLRGALGLTHGQIAYLGSDFSEEDNIGSGSDANVYKTQWEGVDVAVKVLRCRDSILKRFGEEISKLSVLHHPNLCQLIGIGTTRLHKQPALILELLGNTLEKCSIGDEREKDDSLLSYLCDTVAAVRFLHKKRIIHRDLTPKNVLIKNGVAKVCDFGVAKLLSMSVEQQLHQTKCPGTFLYMPPEALTADRTAVYGTPLDIYSAGVLILSVVTGCEPSVLLVMEPRTCRSESIGADGEREVHEKVIAEVERRRTDVDRLPDGHPLKEIVLRCLSNAPGDRPTAADLHDEVKSAASYLKDQSGVHLQRNGERTFQQDVIRRMDAMEDVLREQAADKEELSTDQQARLDGREQKLTDLKRLIAQVGTSITAVVDDCARNLGDQMGSVSQRVAKVESAFKRVGHRTEEIYDNVESNGAALSAMDGRVSAVQQQVSGMTATVSSVRDQVATGNDFMDAVHGQVTSVQQRVDANHDGIVAIRSYVASTHDRTAAVDVRTADTRERVLALDGHAASMNSQLSVLIQRVPVDGMDNLATAVDVQQVTTACDRKFRQLERKLTADDDIMTAARQLAASMHRQAAHHAPSGSPSPSTDVYRAADDNDDAGDEIIAGLLNLDTPDLLDAQGNLPEAFSTVPTPDMALQMTPATYDMRPLSLRFLSHVRARSSIGATWRRLRCAQDSRLLVLAGDLFVIERVLAADAGQDPLVIMKSRDLSSWQHVPSPRHDGSFASSGDSLYCYAPATDEIYRYAPAAGSAAAWTVVARVPYPHAGCTLYASETHISLCGGRQDGKAVSSYSLVSRAWRSTRAHGSDVASATAIGAPPPPPPRLKQLPEDSCRASLVQSGGKTYLVGGTHDSVMKCGGDGWVPVYRRLSFKGCSVCSVTEGRIAVAGGGIENGRRYLRHLWSDWTANLPDLPSSAAAADLSPALVFFNDMLVSSSGTNIYVLE